MASDLSTLVRAQALQQLRGGGHSSCRCARPAQGLLDEIQFPWNIRDLISSTNGDYERVNATAKGNAGWDAEYRSWQEFYARNKDPGWFSSSQETVEEIRRRQTRLGEWQRELKAAGIGTGPQVTASGPAPLASPPASGWGDFGEKLSGLVKWGVVGVGLWAGVKALGLAEGVQKKG